LALWIRDQGYTHVYIANFSGSRDGLPEHLIGGKSVWDRIQTWPFYSMQLALQSCLEEFGIETTEMDPRRPHECPKCFEEAGQLQLKRRRFKCTACGHFEHLDVARARRILARAVDLRAGNSSGATTKRGGKRKKT
ncbi:MAG: transposase, partial [Gammaproteobacteria bacterium]|nr:transposase [Gammaproteobacteria bacterium]NIR83881.1 transposase [Gammaproteobacteria bacterium]NIU05191.1 transposase [Gammaproteobacteria bacterium]NIV52039.1 transposase [Gammaproteobacteria bacterium]NIX86464.1 transposase [Gammaproteobacteria bacterium]